MTDVRKAAKTKLLKARQLMKNLPSEVRKSTEKELEAAEKLIEQYDKTRKPMHTADQKEMIRRLDDILLKLSA